MQTNPYAVKQDYWENITVTVIQKLLLRKYYWCYLCYCRFVNILTFSKYYCYCRSVNILTIRKYYVYYWLSSWQYNNLLSRSKELQKYYFSKKLSKSKYIHIRVFSSKHNMHSTVSFINRLDEIIIWHSYFMFIIRDLFCIWTN